MNRIGNKGSSGKLATVFVVLIVAVIAFFVIRAQLTSSTITPVPEEVAKWIGEHSVVYAQPGCSHCIEQEKLFGENWKYIRSVDCKQDIQACINANITATPTWIINGQQYVGVQSVEKLKELTGYTG